MTAAIEKIEGAHDEGLDEHDDRSCRDGAEGDDIESSNDIEDDVAWAGQTFLDAENHFDGRLVVGKIKLDCKKWMRVVETEERIEVDVSSASDCAAVT